MEAAEPWLRVSKGNCTIAFKMHITIGTTIIDLQGNKGGSNQNWRLELANNLIQAQVQRFFNGIVPDRAALDKERA